MQEPAETALEHRLIIALKHAFSSACGSGHWFLSHLSHFSGDLLDDLSGSCLRLLPQASLQTAMLAALLSIAGLPVQRNAASQASESVVDAVSDLLLASIILLAVLSHARVSE
jgi:hypothetical protein